jgi:hypothetical protein
LKACGPGETRTGVRREPDRHSKKAGFALILVIWLLVLIGSIGAYLVANGRAETAIAFNMRAAASAEALADAGIARVVFNQTDPKTSSRWQLNGEVYRITLPAGSLEIRLEDETQKINPNLASETLLAALFEVCGTDRSTARQRQTRAVPRRGPALRSAQCTGGILGRIAIGVGHDAGHFRIGASLFDNPCQYGGAGWKKGAAPGATRHRACGPDAAGRR